VVSFSYSIPVDISPILSLCRPSFNLYSSSQEKPEDLLS
jgi:hypothetical protein